MEVGLTPHRESPSARRLIVKIAVFQVNVVVFRSPVVERGWVSP